MASTVAINASYYQQFNADLALDVPAEGYAGWKQDTLDIGLNSTAVVVMHAWGHQGAGVDGDKRFPGWYRAVEYIPRSIAIMNEVFPPLLAAVRKSPVKLYHVVGGGDYYKQCPGYKRAVELAPEEIKAPYLPADDARQKLNAFRGQNVFVGPDNVADVQAGFKTLDFGPNAFPQDDEAVCEDANQLAAVCAADGVNHLIYAGFAINWCLLMSPGGMLDMSRRGAMCSAIRQAVTAVENKASARTESNKEEALWRVALSFGFVFEADELAAALTSQDNA